MAPEWLWTRPISNARRTWRCSKGETDDHSRIRTSIGEQRPRRAAHHPIVQQLSARAHIQAADDESQQAAYLGPHRTARRGGRSRRGILGPSPDAATAAVHVRQRERRPRRWSSCGRRRRARAPGLIKTSWARGRRRCRPRFTQSSPCLVDDGAAVLDQGSVEDDGTAAGAHKLQPLDQAQGRIVEG
jgi:hypothetical protein